MIICSYRVMLSYCSVNLVLRYVLIFSQIWLSVTIHARQVPMAVKARKGYRLNFFCFRPFLAWFFVTVSFICLLMAPALAEESATPVMDSPDYVTGQVEEILSEKTVVDEAFGHQEKKFRFKVRFPGRPGKPAESVIVEQAYTPESPKELMPAKGKKYIFFQDVLVDGSRTYTLVDIQRSGHLGWTGVLAALVMVVVARWYGLKPLLVSGGLVISFFLGHLLHLPWTLLSIVSLGATVAIAGLLTFGTSRRLTATLSAALLSMGVTLVLVWIGSWFALADMASLFGGAMVLQLAGGLTYIVIHSVNAVHLTYRSEPTLTASELLRKSLATGRSSVEVITTLYLVIFLAQALTATYGQQEAPGLMQMEPVLAELVSLFFLLTSLVLALPLSCWLGVRMLYRRRV